MRLGVVLSGPAAFLLTVFVPSPAGFAGPAWLTLGLAAWMAIWWATEAVPLAVTALLPLLVVPLIGIAEPTRILTEYANSTIFLILGGFLIGLAMERWQLHKRIAYAIIAAVGNHPRQLVLGVMIATAFMSMWVSNTSTTLMMLPVASSIVALVATGGREQAAANFVTATLLGVAYAATIGGLGTLIGSPTNALVQGFMAKNFGYDLSFATWLSFGIPTVLVLLPLTWLILTRVALPFDLPADALPRDAMRKALHALGPMTAAERRVAAVALATAILWISRPWLGQLPGLTGLTDTVISIAAGLALYLIPAGAGRGAALLDAEALRRVPWDVLILFGGGLALAAAIQASALSDALGIALRGIAHWPALPLTLVVVLMLVFWTEFNSNVATAATFLPVLAAMANGNPDQILVLIAPAAMAASAGFMLPVGTPPNAIVFGTGRISMRQMLRTGFWIDLTAVIVITAVTGVVL
ncbi:MAG TPA: DASS family sodium-coupled anion symporter [Steroidobacteraceae bacterium]|nr:DASS family sodium-coupled anion symporter [Steroidobacteraceae bacterium]HQX46672.1 DASS family sodium-coupled anion symporter [Steroidobacteraceae bacterium]HQZ80015.1 DASS family sodium-coupled anion symporter [Steroidobacteraceae bacterium]